jgi:hypothetical protein
MKNKMKLFCNLLVNTLDSLKVGEEYVDGCVSEQKNRASA